MSNESNINGDHNIVIQDVKDSPITVNIKNRYQGWLILVIVLIVALLCLW